MKKKTRHPFHVLSDRVCVTAGCDRRIKLRMVEQCDAETCYRCWQGRRRALRGIPPVRQDHA